MNVIVLILKFKIKYCIIIKNNVHVSTVSKTIVEFFSLEKTRILKTTKNRLRLQFSTRTRDDKFFSLFSRVPQNWNQNRKKKSKKKSYSFNSNNLTTDSNRQKFKKAQ